MKRTPLYEKQKALNARLVEFGGWEMPVQYSGIIDEHLTTRSHVGLFDVSHMGEIEITGPDATPFLQRIVTQNLLKSQAGAQVQYALMCYENGGVVDDILIYKRADDAYFLCVNASNIEKDFNWIQSQKKREAVEIKNSSAAYAQLAVQGPDAQKLLQKLTGVDLSQIKYYRFTTGSVLGIEMILSRTGYTGEDGFEIYMPAAKGPPAWDALLKEGKPFQIKPCGLGARDTLRIEMRYPLYGHEISENISPLEADLEWVIKWGKDDFIGKTALTRQKEKGLARKLVGFEIEASGIPRQGYEIRSPENELIGEVTSGTLSPTLKKGIGIGFVKASLAKMDSPIQIMIRSKAVKAKIVRTPFVRRKETA